MEFEIGLMCDLWEDKVSGTNRKFGGNVIRFRRPPSVSENVKQLAISSELTAQTTVRIHFAESNNQSVCFATCYASSRIMHSAGPDGPAESYFRGPNIHMHIQPES